MRYKRRHGVSRAKLDRALAGAEWLSLFPTAKVYNLWSVSSDHKPIKIQLESLGARDDSALSSGCMNDATYVEVMELKRQLEDFLDKEDIVWKQRSKIQWMREGDRSTAFFHAYATEKR
ncbi:hypothetical protein ACH5RR_006944 [Cinchona calisaya]|uniref:Uncharacterized protein n=1 Tax=Cinchona calisaya TaxID=153742 RepID=A0ABD3AQF1_9GENT